MSVKRTGIIDVILRDKISELMDFALETPSERADVFVEFAAHCNVLDVRAFIGGWAEGKEAVANHWITLPRSDDPELTTVKYVINQIDNVINEIKEAIKS